ncbi:hypothetical protein [Tenacibaculum geojense]|uniref:Uncharacterized protein n=1 Tax=Tenacibaculum geojense TaxID=915352 RepID=A0ABW3JMK1_9FLAO
MIIRLITIFILIPLGIFCYFFFKRKPTTEINKKMKNKAALRFILGLIIFIAGVILTSISNGKGIFYGAILGGFIMFLSSIYTLYKVK